MAITLVIRWLDCLLLRIITITVNEKKCMHETRQKEKKKEKDGRAI